MGIPSAWCRWCAGRGCVACPQPPKPPDDLPEPLLVITAPPEADPEGWRVLREALGREAIDKAFGPGGGSIEELRLNVAAWRLVTALNRAHAESESGGAPGAGER